MKRSRKERLRLGVIYVLISGFFVVAVARLVHFQVFLSGPYGEIVDRQSTGRVAIPAERGAVYDRFGQLVARNVISSSLYAYPRDEQELRRVAAYLDDLLGYRPGASRKKFRLAVRKFSWIKRHLPDSQAGEIEREAPAGLFLREESRRAYPFGPVGKQILGFTDIDNKGQAGLEYAFDSLLAGSTGYADIRRDGLRNTYRVKESALVKPVAGTSVVLTVDWRLQDIAEEELCQAVGQYNAASGMAVFLDCRSGDILAMAHYDVKEGITGKPTKLRAVTDQFEPGSVFKPFTAAALMEAGLVDYSDSIYCEQGKWRIGRRVLHDDKEHGWLSFRQVMELSSNIGVAKWALRISGDELLDTYRRFGFGQKVRCGLPGEVAGRLAPPSRWSDYNVAALSMGHSVAVTALQLATAFAAIANDGQLLQPRLLHGYVDEDGYVVDAGGHDVIGRAADSEVLDSLRSILLGVVERGTAKPVKSPMVMIAGKTGTAEIPDLENGGYLKNRFTSSFAGFFPYDLPIVAGVVVLKDPRPVTYGGFTAGPVFRRIAERYTVLNPDLFAAPGCVLAESPHRLGNTTVAPDLVGRDITLAKAMAEERELKLRSSATKGRVVWQFPPADRLLFGGDQVLVAVEPPGDSCVLMEDFTGLDVRTAAAFLNYAGMKYTIGGGGRVVSQSVRPGEVIVHGAGSCRLHCRPT